VVLIDLKFGLDSASRCRKRYSEERPLLPTTPLLIGPIAIPKQLWPSCKENIPISGYVFNYVLVQKGGKIGGCGRKMRRDTNALYMRGLGRYFCPPTVLPWEYCRLHYGKVQSPQPQGVGVVVQGGYQAPWTHWNPLKPTGSSEDPPPVGLAYRGKPTTIVTSVQPIRCPGILWILALI